MDLTILSLPVAAVLAAILSTQIGAAVGKSLFAAVGPAGAVALRLFFGGCALLAVRRPWRHRLSRPGVLCILAYGATVGAMNLLFYMAISRVPLGIAVAVEFTGPLTVALLSSRRPADLAWVGLAALGLVLLLPGGPRTLDLTGLAFALGAGACWACYILLARKAGTLIADPGQAAALGIVVAGVLVVPFGLAQAGRALFDPALLPAALSLGLLSSALPFSLEMYALKRVPVAAFGILMSLEPAFGALAGLGFLGERLTLLQGAAVLSIMTASLGSTMSNRATP